MSRKPIPPNRVVCRVGSLNHCRIRSTYALQQRQEYIARAVGPSSSVPVNYVICLVVLWNCTLICHSLGLTWFFCFPPCLTCRLQLPSFCSFCVYILPPKLNSASWLTWQTSCFDYCYFVGFHLQFFTMPNQFNQKMYLLHLNNAFFFPPIFLHYKCFQS